MKKMKVLSDKEKTEINQWFHKIDEIVATKKAEIRTASSKEKSLK